MATLVSSAPTTPIEPKPEFEFSETVQRVLAQGRVNLDKELARLRSLGIIDEEGNLVNTDLPADMQSGLDRDFGG